MDWFLFDNGLRHERVKYIDEICKLVPQIAPRSDFEKNKLIMKNVWSRCKANYMSTNTDKKLVIVVSEINEML